MELLKTSAEKFNWNPPPLFWSNIYINGGAKEQDTEKWPMAAKFDDKDYFSIFFSFIQMKLSLKIGNQLKLIQKNIREKP